MARHEVLRTTFRKSSGGEPEQVIGGLRSHRLPIVDIERLSPAIVEAALDRLALVEARRPFNLASDPLLRVTILRVRHDRHVVLFTMHHIVSDAWSTGVLVRELSELYLAFVSGRSSSLPALPIQYADFAAWQRQWLEGGELQNQLGYWARQLEGIPDRLELPLDGRRGSDVTYNGAPVMNAQVDFSLSDNPVFRFYFMPKQPGSLRVEVEDTFDQRYVQELRIAEGIEAAGG